MAEMRIKRATQEQAQLLAEIGATTFYDSFASQNEEANIRQYINETFTPENIEREMQQEGNVFFLLYADEQAIGYAKLSTQNIPEALQGRAIMELARIYVLKKHQGIGAGKQLLQHGIAYARENGCEVLWLGVWEHNYSSIEFYRRAGFERFGEHVFQLGDDPQTDWLMQLPL